MDSRIAGPLGSGFRRRLWCPAWGTLPHVGHERSSCLNQLDMHRWQNTSTRFHTGLVVNNVLQRRVKVARTDMPTNFMVDGGECEIMESNV
jgi:hypothetical protein